MDMKYMVNLCASILFTEKEKEIKLLHPKNDHVKSSQIYSLG